MSAALIPLVAIAGLVVGSTTASAEPRPTVATVQKKVDKLQHDAEVATEQYNATREELKSANIMAQAASVRVEQQRKGVAVAREALAKLAVQNYKAGDLQTLSLFLDEDPDQLLAMSGLMTTLTDRQATGVQRLVEQQRKLAADQAEVKAQQEKLAQSTAKLQSLRKQVQGKLAEANALLSRLRADEREALRRASRSMDRDALGRMGVRVPANGVLSCGDVKIESPNADVSKVIAYACAQLGKPYRWGGEGPNGFDCSGLTLMAWARAGVNLPHNAAQQSRYGTQVSVSNLRPGDLIYFHSPISHVGIYVGKGLMLHAPRTGDVVKIASARLDEVVSANRL